MNEPGRTFRALVDDQPVWRVEPWVDPVVEEFGYNWRDPYVETFWLPILGPTATWMMRRLSVLLIAQPEGLEMDMHLLGRHIGVATSGKKSRVKNAVERMCQFGMMRDFPGYLLARTMVSPLTRHHLKDLPEDLRQLHDRLERKTA